MRGDSVLLFFCRLRLGYTSARFKLAQRNEDHLFAGTIGLSSIRKRYFSSPSWE